MHECYTVRDWIDAWVDDGQDHHPLGSCLQCGAPEGGAVGLCPDCHGVLDASPGVPDEVLACPRCMSAADELAGILDGLEHFDPAVAAESLEVDDFFRALSALPADVQQERVRTERSFRRWCLCQRFLAEAEAAWCRDTALAYARAATGAVIADALEDDRYHPRWVADLRAKAHAYLANSFRILGRYEDAERELRIALDHLRRGVGSGRMEARVLSLEASLRVDQGREGEAEALLARVETYHQASGELPELARTQLQRALVYARHGEYRAAAEECARAYGNLDPREQPRLALLACQNAAHYLVHGGEVGRARALFDSLAMTDERIVLLRRKWIEADLLRAEARLSEAMDTYEEARRGYAEESLPQFVALISLDQALTAHEMGNHEAMRELAHEAQSVLASAGAGHETLAALRVLATAIEERTVTRSVLAAIRKRVADARPSC